MQPSPARRNGGGRYKSALGTEHMDELEGEQEWPNDPEVRYHRFRKDRNEYDQDGLQNLLYVRHSPPDYMSTKVLNDKQIRSNSIENFE